MSEIQSKSIDEIDWDYVYSQLHGKSSLLYSAEVLRLYPNIEILTIGNEHLEAIWPIPFSWHNGHKIVQRDIRLLPYHAPLIFKNHPLERRSIMCDFLEYIQHNYYSMNLPLAPFFHDLTPFSAFGMLVEWRNTHIFTLGHNLKEHLHSKAKNHISFAQKHLEVKISHQVEDFDFHQGIITNQESHRILRKNVSKVLLQSRRGVVFTAKNAEEVMGQALVVRDNQTAYLFHTWFKKKSIRGIPSYLINKVSQWVLEEEKCMFFDLEGSIINQVDRFFSSLGGIQTPFAYIYWSKTKEELFSMLESSLFMPIRLETSRNNL